MLRRAWWTLCRLESRQSEDENRRVEKMDWSIVPMPLNLNDLDLDPNSSVAPQSRSGLTDMTFCLVSFELKRIVPLIMSAKSDASRDAANDKDVHVVSERLKIIANAEKELETRYLQYCHESRPLDWLSMALSKLVLVRCSFLLILQPKRSCIKLRCCLNSIRSINSQHLLLP